MSNSIAEAFKKLNVTPGADLSEHQQIFSISYDYLTKVKNYDDLKAFKNCLISLINLDRYYKAYEIIQKIPQDYVVALILEISYVYYKIGKSDALVELYNSTNIDNEGLKVGLKHILAQNYYKIGEYEKALELYHDLIENNKYDNKVDVIVNERSVISQLNFFHKTGLQSTYDHSEYGDNYDLLFNEALIQLSNNDLSLSLQSLEKAEQICESQNIDLSQADLISEVLPIKLTRAYVYELQGEIAKSIELLDSIDVDAIQDTILKLIVKNNKYLLTPQTLDLNLVERDLDYQTALQKLGQKLTKYQYQIIKKNSLKLRYATGTLSTSQISNKFINQYLKDFTGDLVPLVYKVLLKIDISFQDLEDQELDKQVAKKLHKHLNALRNEFTDEYIVTVLLTLFAAKSEDSISRAYGELKSAVAVNLTQAKLVPGLISVFLSIEKERKEGWKQEDRVIEHLLATEKDTFNDLHYFNFAKTVALLNQKPGEPATPLIQFLSTVRQDKIINSVLNQSNDELLSIESLASSKSLEQLVSSQAVDELASQIVPQKPVHEILGKTIKKTPSKVVKKRTKKQKVPKFSKNKVLKPEGEFEIDEERWLPMKLRSYYKPTKKERKKLGGGHQGALEFGSGTSSPAPESQTSSSSGDKKKKKKKGKK
ncbi:uncharacterized protein CANTADRAFT_19521 [Suhomyces tanzawaensis NRRL Y-17324]|uniref:Signal recognition particle subunit SRP72 n=1 Tax=Suhomyces tanzawaensis NRRL Y-17324 TaxID=984487 RepID=A0A1E4SQZ1_9ASCO|nr:uncharacterized protein CANTADRAFT_19521 [Suhomyces tanzawaensis NRRL Y-17324]ODV81915.1 hypothetical protein CANTADRAFT_19521 [Suhomyces tanzawaensis NRRL Y-17324]